MSVIDQLVERGMCQAIEMVGKGTTHIGHQCRAIWETEKLRSEKGFPGATGAA